MIPASRPAFASPAPPCPSQSSSSTSVLATAAATCRRCRCRAGCVARPGAARAGRRRCDRAGRRTCARAQASQDLAGVGRPQIGRVVTESIQSPSARLMTARSTLSRPGGRPDLRWRLAGTSGARSFSRCASLSSRWCSSFSTSSARRPKLRECVTPFGGHLLCSPLAPCAAATQLLQGGVVHHHRCSPAGLGSLVGRGRAHGHAGGLVHCGVSAAWTGRGRWPGMSRTWL